MAKTQTSERKESCEKCKFFFRTKATNTTGYCQYYPPVRLPEKSTNVFPRVTKDRFCGKFKKKDLKVGAVLR